MCCGWGIQRHVALAILVPNIHVEADVSDIGDSELQVGCGEEVRVLVLVVLLF